MHCLASLYNKFIYILLNLKKTSLPNPQLYLIFTKFILEAINKLNIVSVKF